MLTNVNTRQHSYYLFSMLASMLGIGLLFFCSPAGTAAYAGASPLAHSLKIAQSNSSHSYVPGRVNTAPSVPCSDSAAWSTTTTPNIASNSVQLYGVATVSGNDAWAVGEQYETAYSGFFPLVEHWNGSSWTTVSATQFGGSLRALTVIASNDIWAVGSTAGYGSHAFTIHWNGAAWSSVTPPGVRNSKLFAVAGTSSNDVWAAGVGNNLPLIYHWNGTQWSIVNGPTFSDGVLNGLAVVGQNDAWAVGTSAASTQALTLHWNGSQWEAITNPSIGSYQNVLRSVAAVASADVWAVGYNANSPTSIHGTTLHWNGTQWSIVTNGTESSAGNASLYSVAALSPGQVWAAGRNSQGSSVTTQILLWDGTDWSQIPSTNPGYATSQLFGIAAGPAGAGGAWTVGSVDQNAYGETQPLIELYNPPCNTPVGHVTWQGPPAQPDPRQRLPYTITFCQNGSTTTYTGVTDSSGYYSMTMGLPGGTYSWTLKGTRYLATSGTLTLPAAGGAVQVDMGVQRAGDANNGNSVNVTDFSILKTTFGGALDPRADFNNDGFITISDFNLLHGNFGAAGATSSCP